MICSPLPVLFWDRQPVPMDDDRNISHQWSGGLVAHVQLHVSVL